MLPEDWKKALITPVYKKASRSNPANYRPVSLTCISCKLLEHIVNRHILNHLDAHKIIADSQHGFSKRRSCETQLLLTCHDLTREIDKCGQVDMLVLDFAKAFDTVANERLRAKIHSYGITSSLYKWIESFLKGRTQRVVVEGESSAEARVKSGVPQGSVLGPLLFLIFINDLAEKTTSTVRLFADDCVMYRPIRHANDCEALQEDFNKLHDWEERWQLRFNATKCNILRATHARKKIITKNYKLNGVSLAETSSTTYLGVELSADMNWNIHVKKTAAKGNQMLGVLHRNLKNCPRNLKDLAYKSILRLKLEYASSVWDPYTAENINKLEGVQRRSARFVCNKYSRKESVTSMLDDLEGPPLQQRRAESRLALFHCIVNGTVDIDSAVLMEESRRPSRKANKVQYMRHSSKKDCYKYSFVPRSIVQWNNINAPDDHAQFKSMLSLIDLRIGGDTYKY